MIPESLQQAGACISILQPGSLKTANSKQNKSEKGKELMLGSIKDQLHYIAIHKNGSNFAL